MSKGWLNSYDSISETHIVRVERTSDLFINYYHSSLGTLTRVASIDLKLLPIATGIFICLTWSPQEISLLVGSHIPNGQLHTAVGQISQMQLRADAIGAVYRIGDIGADVMGLRVYQGSQPVLMPTALEVWKETIKMAEILASGVSPEGFIFEMAIANVTLSVLVSGFEVYTKRRFLEMEKEGKSPDLDALIKDFYPNNEYNAKSSNELNTKAQADGKSVIEYLVAGKKINFQDYDHAKRAFNKAYKIQFGTIVSSQIIENLRRYFTYRHQIIHVEPLIPIYNITDHPSQHIVASKKVAEKARTMFNEFILKLHEASL